MKWSKKCYGLILLVVLAALALRLPRLAQRPMHGDEAVNAVKFGQLLEDNFYRYDRHEFHGPTLNYLTLIPAWLSSARSFSQVSEFTLRIVPVFFAILLVMMPLLLVRGLGKTAAITAAAFTAVSPAMVFYSRYYIHEMLLVCFTFGTIVCGYRYAQNKRAGWAVLTGLFAGLMYATKETCMIAFASMLLALFLVLMLRERTLQSDICVPKLRHVAAGACTAVAVAVLFYSSFFTNPEGLADSVRSYTMCINRAVSSGLHIHPWHYYLKMLTWSKHPAGPVFTEAVIVVLAVTGFVAAMIKRPSQSSDVHLVRFIAFYSLTITAVYSAVPYKTPWCMLTFLHGMILLAATGAVALVQMCSKLSVRAILSFVLIAGLAHLSAQAYLTSYTFSSDPVNPYVYAHSTTDVLQIARRVEQIACIHPAGRDMQIQVISPRNDYWPLPWYLRNFANVGWYDKVDDSAPVGSVIITTPEAEVALSRRLYEIRPPGTRNLYVPVFDESVQLRPGVEITGFTAKDLWDKLQVTNDDQSAPR
ncbi:MAG: flippase activity-associated protein Agl23 [Planctomycetota bacterium]|jgi:uncharacterized protein (TIGR03663 family)